MAEPWVAIVATVRRNEKLTALPSDTARWGFIVALGEAKLLYRQGTFTPGQWAELMGRYARLLPEYIRVGLIHVAPQSCDVEHRAACLRGRGPFPAGTLVIHDWPRHQREHAARQSGYRSRVGRGDGPSDVGSDVGSDVSRDVGSDANSDVPSRALSHVTVSTTKSMRIHTGGVGGESSAGGDVWDVALLVEELTGRPWSYGPGSRIHETLAADVLALGTDTLTAAYRAVVTEANGRPLDAAGVVFGAHKRLYAIPEAPRTRKAKGLLPSSEEVNRAFGR